MGYASPCGAILAPDPIFAESSDLRHRGADRTIASYAAGQRTCVRYAFCNMKVWTLAIFLLACSGPSDKGVKAPRPADDAPLTEAETATKQPKPPADAKLTEAECDAFFGRIFDFAAEHQRATLPPERQPTEADVAKVKAEKRAKMVPECMTHTRADLNYDCFMAAPDLDGLGACEEG